MKHSAVLTGLFALVLVSCPNPAESPKRAETVDPPGPNSATKIVFDNTRGTCPVLVYDDYRREPAHKIAEVPEGTASNEIPWQPSGSYPFYFSYIISLNGVDDFSVSYVPDTGRDQVAVRIDADTKTKIVIPGLDETIADPDALLSRNSYIAIQNTSSYSFQLYRDHSWIMPDKAASAVVNAGERALYTVSPGAASPYSILSGAETRSFDGTAAAFEAGHFYQFYFDGNGISLGSDIPVTAANMRLPAPGAPVLTAGNRELRVRWEPVEKASAYEVWTGTSSNSAEAVKYGADITGGLTQTAITGLVNGTAYYVWIKAKNAAGTSGLSPAASGTPDETALYKGAAFAGAVLIGNLNLNAALSYIAANAVSGDNYFIVLMKDIQSAPVTLSYSGKTVGITLMTDGAEITLQLASSGNLFTVDSGVTLTLENNVTLKGRAANTASLVGINSGGIFTMNGGEISGNTTSLWGGGVNVSGGTFLPRMHDRYRGFRVRRSAQVHLRGSVQVRGQGLLPMCTAGF